jgi:pseudaminic acid cytidylyltransferase
VKVALIPARGGSKRIPGKNVRAFLGKPIIAHSIHCALHSGLFDRVIVSTDDDRIAGTARECGAEVPFRRPEALADDYTGTTAVVAHAIKWLREQGADPEIVCCIYPTAPLIDARDLSRGLELLQAGQWKFVFAATSYGASVYRAFRQCADGALEMLYPEKFAERSQDLPEVFHDAAQFYWGTASAWVDGIRVFGESSTIVPVPRWRVQDIDTEEDWVRAEALAKSLVC